jgi:hypothetical protein
MSKATKSQVFCADCGVRLSDSIYPPALSRKDRGHHANGNIKPKKYVCHDCSVMQAMSSLTSAVR